MAIYNCCLDLKKSYLKGNEIIYLQFLCYNGTMFKGPVLGLLLKMEVLFTVVNYTLQTMKLVLTGMKYRTRTTAVTFQGSDYWGWMSKITVNLISAHGRILTYSLTNFKVIQVYCQAFRKYKKENNYNPASQNNTGNILVCTILCFLSLVHGFLKHIIRIIQYTS